MGIITLQLQTSNGHSRKWCRIATRPWGSVCPPMMVSIIRQEIISHSLNSDLMAEIVQINWKMSFSIMVHPMRKWVKNLRVSHRCTFRTQVHPNSMSSAITRTIEGSMQRTPSPVSFQMILLSSRTQKVAVLILPSWVPPQESSQKSRP